MRKKILALIMVATMLATTLVGCGSDTSNENTIDETVNVESSEVVETVESGDASGTLGDIADEPIESETPTTEESSESEETLDVHDETQYSEIGYYTFPIDTAIGNGYTHKYVYANNQEWSYNETHFENVSKNFVVDFSWNGLKETASKATYIDGAMFLLDEMGNIVAISDITVSSESTWNAYNDATKEQFETLGYCNEYDGTEYFNKEQTNDTVIITFTVKNDADRGYGKHIIDKNNNVLYAFYYRESYTTYDDERAMNIINSITLLDNPLESRNTN